MDELLTLSVLELSEKIRTRQISPVEVVNVHIERIQQVNPVLNAVVMDRFHAARKEAKLAEKAVLDGEELPPLHGVPCTVKEMLCLDGFPISVGSIHRRGLIPKEEATVVSRIRSAGAIPMGITNLPEMAFWTESYNLNYGRTNNPHNIARTPGGSSGGEAAIIAAGGSPFGIGSDGGGSIRIPSFYCGIFGHKPTPGLIPVTGHFPFDGSINLKQPVLISSCITVGPMTRRASDLWPLVKIIAGPDGKDPRGEVRDIPDSLEQIDFKGKRVLLYESPKVRFASRASEDVRMAVKKVADILAEHGAHVENWEHREFINAMEIWNGVLACESDPDYDLRILTGNGKRPKLIQELICHLIGRPNYTLPTLMFCLGEKLSQIQAHRLPQFVEKARQLREDIENALGPDGIMVMPTLPEPAPRHYMPMLKPFDFTFSAIFNALNLPATAVPMGLGRQGLPVGVQIVGSYKRDDLTVATANLIEQATGGWQMPRNSFLPGSKK